MNESFPRFLRLPQDQQRDVFEAAAEDLDTRATYVEKDFWVSLALDILYNGLAQNRPRILFKGGTSLSKVYGLIQRFSEDVDFTIFSEDMGFTGARDLNDPSLSKKQKKNLSKEVIQTTAQYIYSDLKSSIEKIIIELPVSCSISIDETDKNLSTLLLNYPSLFENGNNSYVQPTVKLEGGGRSAVDPHNLHGIKPLIADTLTDWDFSVANVLTIDAQRTFWDKIFILHGLYYGYQNENRIPADRQRLSRHYYDVAMIYNSEIGKEAVENDELRNKVRQHKIDFFNVAWKKFDLAVPDSLKVVPYGDLRQALRQDYQAMQGMIVGDACDFDEIIQKLTQLEASIQSRS
jgi:Nucleotidyl transferase AbiEii toxin, Type IV TA system